MQVIWSARARHELKDAARQCRKTFGDRVTERFLQHISEDESRLAAHPRLGKLEPLLDDNPRSYRSLVVHKHYKIVYYIKGDALHVTDFWDTRREPASLVRNPR